MGESYGFSDLLFVGESWQADVLKMPIFGLSLKSYFSQNPQRMSQNLNFSQALEAIHNGKFVAREGWNGKGMYLWLLPAAEIKSEWCKDPHLKALADANGGVLKCNACIRMLCADQTVTSGWAPSQTDMMASDWVIVPQ